MVGGFPPTGEEGFLKSCSLIRSCRSYVSLLLTCCVLHGLVTGLDAAASGNEATEALQDDLLDVLLERDLSAQTSDSAVDGGSNSLLSTKLIAQEGNDGIAVEKIPSSSSSAVGTSDELCSGDALSDEEMKIVSELLKSNSKWTVLLIFGMTYVLLFVLFVPLYMIKRDHPAICARSPIFCTASNAAGFIVVAMMCVWRGAISMKSYTEIMHLYEWSTNAFLPFFLVCTMARIWRLGQLDILEEKKIVAAKRCFEGNGGSKANLLEEYTMEHDLITTRARLSETRLVRHMLWISALLLGWAFAWHAAIVKCMTIPEADSIAAVAISVFLTAALLPFCYSVRHVDEAFGVRRELYVMTYSSIMFAASLAGLFVHMKAWDSRFVHALPLMSVYHYVIVMWMFVSLLLTVIWPLYLIRPKEIPPPPVRAPVMRDLASMIQHEVGMDQLRAFTRREFSTELLSFWNHVNLFREAAASKSICEEDAYERLVDSAKAIYNAYIREGSMLDVRVPYETILDCGYRLQSDVGADMFDSAQDAVYFQLTYAYDHLLASPRAARDCAELLSRESGGSSC